MAPTFCARSTNEPTTAPTFCAQSPKELAVATFCAQNSNESGTTPTFRAVARDNKSVAPRFHADEAKEFAAAPTFSVQSENDPFAVLPDVTSTSDPMCNESMNQDSLLHQQRLWLEQQNKIIAKHMS